MHLALPKSFGDVEVQPTDFLILFSDLSAVVIREGQKYATLPPDSIQIDDLDWSKGVTKRPGLASYGQLARPTPPADGLMRHPVLPG